MEKLTTTQKAALIEEMRDSFQLVLLSMEHGAELDDALVHVVQTASAFTGIDYVVHRDTIAEGLPMINADILRELEERAERLQDVYLALEQVAAEFKLTTVEQEALLADYDDNQTEQH